ncbi:MULTISPECIES: alpha-L-rhamnosidase-related protein [Lactobacillus]|uniref:alpha-L-rhamnosidase-related protein n=1 Tax=Lactobacillus TaxID=1578 RepID=UPI001CC390D2
MLSTFRSEVTQNFPSWLYDVNLDATTIWKRWNSVLPEGSRSTLVFLLVKE